MKRSGMLLILAGVALGNGALAQTITDADTLRLGGVTYRIHGIDGPELRQTCPDGWPAGRLAATHLQSLISGRTVTCETLGHDRYRRAIGRCWASGADLGAAMVRDGMALAFTRYSADYVALEQAARASRLGVHSHDCMKPWEWRRRAKSGSQ